MLNIFQIINYIESIERVGCKPFEFIDKNVLIKNYNLFRLIDLDYESNLISWDNVINYSPSAINRIKDKIKDKEKQNYYINKVYNNVLKYPPVLGYNEIIDGSHRLCNIYHNKLKFKAWIPSDL